MAPREKVLELDAEVLSAEDSMEVSPKQAPELRRPRLHYLDWLRLLLVLAVVYAHTSKSGITTGGGFNEAWLVDDRTLFDHKDYADLFASLRGKAHHGPVSGQCVPAHHAPARYPPRVVGRSPLTVRWISIARQWALPLLFWVSGAAVACSYQGGAPRGLLKLGCFTALGMGLNAALWFLGPMDPMCFIGNPDCEGKGLVFSFTVVPWAGMVFAILFQMWYTVMLMGFCITNWPFLALVYGSATGLWALGLQWAITMFIYLFFLCLADGLAVPRLLVTMLATMEVAWLALVALLSPGLEGCERPRWLPVRAVHYLLAGISIAQFGAMPFAHQMESIGATYILYMVAGFNRFFNLGFIMTTSRLSSDERKTGALLSRVWPLAIAVVLFTAPSTNWDLAGMLTYPFFLDTVDRILYVSGAMVLTFLIDRCSHCMNCEALPGILGQTALILYLFHPVLITVLLHFGMRRVPMVWLACVAIALAIAAVVEWAPTVPSKDSRDSSSDEEDE